MPSFHPSYIEKSNENWACVENLLKQASRFPNVIASRMYYSMFQLVKCEMVTNNEDPSLPRDMKMTENASTGVHKLVRDYINSYLVKKIDCFVIASDKYVIASVAKQSIVNGVLKCPINLTSIFYLINKMELFIQV